MAHSQLDWFVAQGQEAAENEMVPLQEGEKAMQLPGYLLHVMSLRAVMEDLRQIQTARGGPSAA